jgi:hypothetical protein
MAITTSSGPGIALKAEGIGLAVMTELPLIIINVQRGGPSTGLPTKTEQADLFQAIFGRNGECPMPVIACRSPADCFDCAQEAWRIATRFMTPCLALRDGYIANGSEPWRVPDVADLPKIEIKHPTGTENGDEFHPYARNERLARPWALPGTPGLMHRIGGLEKQDITGNVSYDPLNHQHMVDTRAAKVAAVANDVPLQEVDGPETGRRPRPQLGRNVRRLFHGGDASTQSRRRRRARPPALHAPVPAQPRRNRQALRQSADPRIEQRSAPHDRPQHLPGRRHRPQQGARQTLHGRRDREQDSRTDEVGHPL